MCLFMKTTGESMCRFIRWTCKSSWSTFLLLCSQILNLLAPAIYLAVTVTMFLLFNKGGRWLQVVVLMKKTT